MCLRGRMQLIQVAGCSTWEFKEMVQFSMNGFRVIMDVVYNHMYSLVEFNKAVPWYYFRTKDDGTISNGSACGNDVASERPMCANYIVDSVLWAEEYRHRRDSV